MKKIEAYIRHEAFEPIRMELLTLGFPSLSISEVKGSGRQKGITERYRGAEGSPEDQKRQRQTCESEKAGIHGISSDGQSRPGLRGAS